MNTTEKEYVDTAAKEMASQIDFDILESVVSDMGWVKLSLTRPVPALEYDEIDKWLKVNCTGRYLKHRRTFLFQHPKDATWFSLRWTS